MTCKIDHSDPVAIPRIMCRVCGTPWDHLEPIAPAVAPAVEAETWRYQVRRSSCTPADIAVMEELSRVRAQSQAVKEYHDQKRLAELEQWRHENPELAKMERKAKRDAERRVAKLGIKATGKVRRGKRAT